MVLNNCIPYYNYVSKTINIKLYVHLYYNLTGTYYMYGKCLVADSINDDLPKLCCYIII